MEELVVMSGIISKAFSSCGISRPLFTNTLSIENRDFWRSVPQRIADAAIRTAEEEKGDFPFLPLSLYKDFLATGERKNYETPFFKKRKMLSDLVIAECIEDKGRFMARIEDGIWSLLSEPGWAIPAHNSYIRDTPQLTMPLIERPVLDLFACETGEILSLTGTLLQGRIDPILGRDIAYELERRILKPYLEDHFWWMGGCGKLNNWSPWCTQNILLSTLPLENLGSKERATVVEKACGTLDLFLDEYADDGCCDEGAQYWHAAALALWGCLFILSDACGGAGADVFENPKVRAMASYIEKVHVGDDIYINYADCSPKAGKLGAREYLFGKAVNDPGLSAHALTDWKKHGCGEDDNNYNLFYKAVACLAAKEMEAESGNIAKTTKPAFSLFKKTGMAIYRKDGVVLGVKAGGNDDSHNHNDVGSITLYDGVKPLLIDIGVETYTKTTFSKDRYTLWPMQSAYHNTVNFPPFMQMDGSIYKATEVHFTPESVIMEMKEAYDRRAGVKTCRRSISFNGRTITVVDEARAEEKPVLSLMSVERPETGACCLSYPSFSISFNGNGGFQVEEIPITDKRLRKAWPEKICRTLVPFEERLVWTIHIGKEVSWKSGSQETEQ